MSVRKFLKIHFNIIIIIIIIIIMPVTRTFFVGKILTQNKEETYVSMFVLW